MENISTFIITRGLAGSLVECDPECFMGPEFMEASALEGKI